MEYLGLSLELQRNKEFGLLERKKKKEDSRLERNKEEKDRYRNNCKLCDYVCSYVFIFISPCIWNRAQVRVQVFNKVTLTEWNYNKWFFLASGF